MVAALHSYTHPTWLRFWGFGSFVESIDVIMSWLRLTATSNCLPPSMLDICKVFEYIAMLSMGIQYQPYTVIVTLLGSYLGLWVTCGVNLM